MGGGEFRSRSCEKGKERGPTPTAKMPVAENPTEREENSSLYGGKKEKALSDYVFSFRVRGGGKNQGSRKNCRAPIVGKKGKVHS